MERERILSSEHTCRLHWLRAYTGLAAVSYPHLIARFHGYCHTWGGKKDNKQQKQQQNKLKILSSESLSQNKARVKTLQNI